MSFRMEMCCVHLFGWDGVMGEQWRADGDNERGVELNIGLNLHDGCALHFAPSLFISFLLSPLYYPACFSLLFLSFTVLFPFNLTFPLPFFLFTFIVFFLYLSRHILSSPLSHILISLHLLF